MALVLGMALVGCRGCSDSEPVAEEVKVRAKQKEDRAEKQKRRASNRADLKKLGPEAPGAPSGRSGP